jgi:membrane-associated phospholipid phosphatase
MRTMRGPESSRRGTLEGWRLWLDGLTPFRRLGPLALVATYWAGLSLLGGLRGDHVIVGLLILLLSYGGAKAEPVLQLLVPLIATGVVYDSRRFYPDRFRAHVHVIEPYDMERRLFGIPIAAGGVLTPSEWWQLHTHPVLDLITGACYITFIPAFVLTAAYFVFRVSRTGSEKRSAEFVRERSPRVMWALLCLNVMAFVTAHYYPAAPPWYVASHGLGPADTFAPANPAGCTRFDRLVGAGVFAAFYGRSVDTFGAIPSLHVAYPLLAVYYAFQFGAARSFSVAVLLLTCFSAIYLNHHYVVDVVVGCAYALFVAGAVDVLCARASRRGGRARPRSVAA